MLKNDGAVSLYAKAIGFVYQDLNNLDHLHKNYCGGVCF
jgi:hypothetical protein